MKGKFKLIAWWLVFVCLLICLFTVGFNITNKESILKESIVVCFVWGIVGMIYLFPERKRVKE